MSGGKGSPDHAIDLQRPTRYENTNLAYPRADPIWLGMIVLYNSRGILVHAFEFS